jgi:hypothetical protein
VSLVAYLLTYCIRFIKPGGRGSLALRAHPFASLARGRSVIEVRHPAVFLSIMRTVLIEQDAWSGDLDRVGA